MRWFQHLLQLVLGSSLCFYSHSCWKSQLVVWNVSLRNDKILVCYVFWQDSIAYYTTSMNHFMSDLLAGDGKCDIYSIESRISYTKSSKMAHQLDISIRCNRNRNIINFTSPKNNSTIYVVICARWFRIGNKGAIFLSWSTTTRME